MKPKEIIKTIEIPIANLDFNENNNAIYSSFLDDNGKIIVAEVEDLMALMDAEGQTQNLTVVEQANGRFKVICGNRRLAAAMLLKMKTLRAEIVPPMTPQEELSYIATDNQVRDKSLKEKLAELDAHLLTFGIKNSEIENKEVDLPIAEDKSTGRDKYIIKDFGPKFMKMSPTRYCSPHKGPFRMLVLLVYLASWTRGGMGHEEAIHGGTDSVCSSPGDKRDGGGRDYPEDGHHGADILSVEEAVRPDGDAGDPPVSSTRGRKSSIEETGG